MLNIFSSNDYYRNKLFLYLNSEGIKFKFINPNILTNWLALSIFIDKHNVIFIRFSKEIYTVQKYSSDIYWVSRREKGRDFIIQFFNTRLIVTQQKPYWAAEHLPTFPTQNQIAANCCWYQEKELVMYCALLIIYGTISLNVVHLCASLGIMFYFQFRFLFRTKKILVSYHKLCDALCKSNLPTTVELQDNFGNKVGMFLWVRAWSHSLDDPEQ